jgi:4-carboxymuconolactone decarboxylase
MSSDEAMMYDFCTQLLSTRQVSDTNFEGAKALIGERGIVEIVGLMGQYTGLTMLFVVDRYPVPPGAPDEGQQADVTKNERAAGGAAPACRY